MATEDEYAPEWAQQGALSQVHAPTRALTLREAYENLGMGDVDTSLVENTLIQTAGGDAQNCFRNMEYLEGIYDGQKYLSSKEKRAEFGRIARGWLYELSRTTHLRATFQQEQYLDQRNAEDQRYKLQLRRHGARRNALLYAQATKVSISAFPEDAPYTQENLERFMEKKIWGPPGKKPPKSNTLANGNTITFTLSDEALKEFWSKNDTLVAESLAVEEEPDSEEVH